MSGALAFLTDAIPIVQGATDRTNKFPNPALNQRVHDIVAGQIQRFGAAGWVVDFLSGGQIPVINVRDPAFGAVGDGSADDSGAVVAAIAAVPPQGGVIYFPPGVYSLKSSVVVNARTDIAFIGAGRNATRIQMGANGVNLLSFTGVCSRIIIRDLWLGSVVAYATGTALSVIGTSGTHSDSFYIDNVTVQNAPQPWVMQYLDNSNIRNVRIVETINGAITAGVVVNLNSCVTDTFENVVLFSTVGAAALGTGEGIRVDYDCDSIDFINCQVLDATTYNWRFCQTAGSTGPRLCRLTNCYSESSGSGGYLVQAARDLRFSGCESAVNGGDGYTVTGGDSIVIENCLALQNQQHGINVTGGTGVSVQNCTCSNNSQQTSNTYSGIWTSATGVRINGNRSGDFIFTLANKQKNGVDLEGAAESCIVTGNDLRGNNNAALVNFSTGVAHIITRNIGNAPAGVAAIAVTASPFTYTNNDGVPEMVYVDGGTITTVVKNGVTIFSFGGTAARAAVALEPTEAVTVTYTVAPTMNKDRK